MHDGLLEMCVDPVIREPGDVVSRVHDATRTGSAPIEYHAGRSGILRSTPFFGLIHCGDTLAVVADVVG